MVKRRAGLRDSDALLIDRVQTVLKMSLNDHCKSSLPKPVQDLPFIHLVLQHGKQDEIK